MTKKITFITSEEGDWERLLIDGVMVADDHRIDSSEWCEILKQHFDVEVEELEKPEEWW